jgi:hypothetical protein
MKIDNNDCATENTNSLYNATMYNSNGTNSNNYKMYMASRI